MVEDNDAEGWCDGFEKGRKKGIEEVVEWIKNNSDEQNSYWHSNLFPKTAITTSDWETKLKE